mmetsp:Transcript_65931/g.176414  ORF Transcript_65931/g.176414 Transcript_65931/m.176414 type:complete len:228 (-) Transcript_65931:592-1275(-)
MHHAGFFSFLAACRSANRSPRRSEGTVLLHPVVSRMPYLDGTRLHAPGAEPRNHGQPAGECGHISTVGDDRPESLVREAPGEGERRSGPGVGSDPGVPRRGAEARELLRGHRRLLCHRRLRGLRGPAGGGAVAGRARARRRPPGPGAARAARGRGGEAGEAGEGSARGRGAPGGGGPGGSGGGRAGGVVHAGRGGQHGAVLVDRADAVRAEHAVAGVPLPPAGHPVA